MTVATCIMCETLPGLHCAFRTASDKSCGGGLGTRLWCTHHELYMVFTALIVGGMYTAYVGNHTSHQPYLITSMVHIPYSGKFLYGVTFRIFSCEASRYENINC